MSSDLEITFTTDADWAVLIAVWVFVIGNWASFQFGGRIMRAQWAALDRRVEVQGSWVIAPGVLAAIAIIWGLLLWLSWSLYLVQDATDGFETFYIIANAMVFAGVVFYAWGQAAIYGSGAFLWAIVLSLFATLLFIIGIAVLIWEIFSISDTGDEIGTNIFLAAVLFFWLLYIVVAVLWRSYIYWGAQAEVGFVADEFIENAGAPANGNANGGRASSVAFAKVK